MKKKCAIYNRLSNQNNELLQAKRDELIKYCKDTLKIDDYVIYEEVSSLNSSRHQFNEMMKKIDEKEFSDILVYNLYNIYRLNYNDEKFFRIIERILSSNTKLTCIKGDINTNINYLTCKHNQAKIEKEMGIEY